MRTVFAITQPAPPGESRGRPGGAIVFGMQNWNDLYELTRYHREDLLRDAANARLASEIDGPRRTWSLQRAVSPLLALLALLVGTHR